MEALKSLGQPSRELLECVLDLVSAPLIIKYIQGNMNFAQSWWECFPETWAKELIKSLDEHVSYENVTV